MPLDNTVALWFGPEKSPLFGIIHVPDVQARGAIVLCPPVGREYSYAHPTFVQLAIRLAQLGFATLRFDYRSTGDSFERTDPDREGFAHDVRSAVEFVRHLGAVHVGLVGMRLGANFVGVQRPESPVDAAVLWDPCVSGRSFLREERAFSLFAGIRLGESIDGRDLPAFKLSPEMVNEITDIDLMTDQQVPVETDLISKRVLLLTRSERDADLKLAQRFKLSHVEHKEVTGQPELLEVYDDWPTLPANALATVAGWLDEVMPRTGAGLSVPSQGDAVVEIFPCSTSSDSAASGEKALVRERVVRLGPARLFGIETELVTGGSGPVCLFVSVAKEHRIGPGRLWVQLSRRLAFEGFRCVRFDINGFGDSPARDGRVEQPVHSASAIDDVLDAARAVSPQDPGAILLFGLCSSGYQILEAGSVLAARGVCALNPSVIFTPPETLSGGPIDSRRRFFFCLPGPPPREKRYVAWLKRSFPTFASALGRCKYAATLGWKRFRGRFRDGPGKRVEDLVHAGTDVLLVCGFTEIQIFFESGLSVRRADRESRLHIEVIPTLDHGLFPTSDREKVSDAILNHVLKQFRPVRETGDLVGHPELGRDDVLQAEAAKLKARP